jgi:hypothetical protein
MDTWGEFVGRDETWGGVPGIVNLLVISTSPSRHHGSPVSQNLDANGQDKIVPFLPHS